ncbi:MAG: IS3 family transposase [Pseudomonadota bacterium]|nr:IS3 family transposase [Pseudomonadota bacterium]
MLQKNGLVASMSGKDHGYNNAPIEIFRGSPKNERVHHQHFETRMQAKSAIREYIGIFYNRQRRHKRIGYLAPAVFAQSFTQKAA